MPKVVHFQRRPFQNQNFSVEVVFSAVRQCMQSSLQVELRVFPWRSKGVLRRLGNILFAAWHQGDVNHITGDVHYAALLLRGKRTVLTILDCRLAPRTRLGKWLVLWLWYKLPVRHVASVTAISETTKEALIQLTGVDPKKVSVIPCPAPPWLTYRPRPFNADRPRILQIGTSANKNLTRLCHALVGIRSTLIVVGPLSEEQRTLISQLKLAVEHYLNLTREEITRLYDECDIVTFVSTFEGFGLPIVEGQTVGRPVITSNLAPMNSVAGPGSSLVDPFDIASIRTAIRRVIDDDQYREAVVACGRENASRFSADKIAALYHTVYSRTLEQTGCPKAETYGVL